MDSSRDINISSSIGSWMKVEKQFKDHHYKPLPSCLEIRKSLNDGHGLYAIEDIPAGSHLGITHLVLTEEQKKFVHLNQLRTPLGGFINHSENPNAVLTPTDGPLIVMWSVKPIKIGEEVTVFYMDGYEDIIDNFGGPKFWGKNESN